MNALCYTLQSDGPTDRMLLPILNWLLSVHLPDHAVTPQFADLRSAQPTKGLVNRIRMALFLYPCDVLFVHRDAENDDPGVRVIEIEKSIKALNTKMVIPRCVPVVPVRMSEAWLLINERAIRRASGNPNGKSHLALPNIKTLEKQPDPKTLLRELLRNACGLQGRRLKNFNAEARVPQVAGWIDDDFTPLRALSAFQKLESDIGQLAFEITNDHEQ
ncbi:hypothetical protein [Fimbriiglobus ruber]|uniref:hypothetical protein n=1 Tax=Fimbriiglobus ruber TaxID=1908690 RepID=UPI000B4AE24E|nr:hypothetical protein [Fimbriiglobus ruber]